MPTIEKKITVTWDEEEVAEIIREEAADVGRFQDRGTNSNRIDLIDGRIVMRASVSIETFQRAAVEELNEECVHWGEGEVEVSGGCVSVSFETTSGM